MANEFHGNVGPFSGQLYGIWLLTRIMKKAGWRVMASSDGTTKSVSQDPTQDKWGGGVVISGQNGTAAHVTTVASDFRGGTLMTVTGLSGLVSPSATGGNSEGRILTLSGSSVSANNGAFQIQQVLSATSCTVYNPSTAAAVDTGSDSWTELEVVQTSYVAAGISPLTGTQAWICMEGPTTQQISFTLATSGTFVRGENVTQASTGATGECLGVVWDPVSSHGWMVVSPRTGSFNSTDVVTGSVSGATVTPANLYTFRRQIVFAKDSSDANHNGSSWYEVVRTDNNEINLLFSNLATNAACTATVPPGGSPTSGNQLPDFGTYNGGVSNGITCPNGQRFGYVIRGFGNRTAAGTALGTGDGFYAKTWAGDSRSNPSGRMQAAAANCLPKPGVSQDGTFWFFHGNPFTGVPSAGSLYMWSRFDGQQPGCVEPYEAIVAAFPGNYPGFSYDGVTSRASDPNHTGGGVYGADQSMLYAGGSNQQYSMHIRIAYRAVGGTNPNPTQAADVMGWSQGNDFGQAAFAAASAAFRVEDHPANVRPLLKEQMGINDCIVGRHRWLFYYNIGTAFDTYENRSFFCISGFQGNTCPALVIGPWDQTTVPLQS